MTVAAFIGYQTVSAWGGRKVGTFPKYLKAWGLAPKGPSITESERQAAIRRSRAIVAKARQAFNRTA